MERTRACTASKTCPTFRTLEVRTEVISGFSEKALAQAIARVQRGDTARALAARRRETVRQLAGKKPVVEIARFLGITEARVRQLASELNTAGELPKPRIVVRRLHG